MKVYYSLEQVPLISKPCALTIGNFDGVHAGHQHLIALLKKNGMSVVITFSNHPSEVITHRPEAPLICSEKHKFFLLEKHGIDIVISLPFTPEFSSLSFCEFLQLVKKKVNFNHLVVGKGASFGKDQKGEETAIKQISKELKFEPHYITRINIEGNPVSSFFIREVITNKNFCLASKLLKRPYSLFLDFHYFPEKENWECKNDKLCLPPTGIYQVGVVSYGVSYPGTLAVDKENATLILKLPSLKISLSGCLPFEVIFPTCNEDFNQS